MIWKICGIVLGAYAVLCILVYIFQRKFLYIQDHTKVSESRAMADGLRYWPSPENYCGFCFQKMPANPAGTVIVFHGNAGTAYDRGFYAKALSALHMRVILAEYPGYGGRAGNPDEKTLVDDALKTIQLAHQAYGDPIILWGESLGCGVVASAVQKNLIPVNGVVLFLPWDSLTDLARTHYGFLPVKWLIKDAYNSVENLKAFKGNAAVVLAGNDEIIPVKHGRYLYESLTTNKRLWVFDHATHNEMPVAPDLPWWESVISFVLQ